jgi:hypothetical protein
MPPVKIRFFLDLGKKFSFLNRKQKELLLSKRLSAGLKYWPAKGFLSKAYFEYVEGKNPRRTQASG